MIYKFCNSHPANNIIYTLDLAIESSQSYKTLRDLLRERADYVIDENGWIAGWGGASFDLNCKSMEFSNYPYDNHMCEFLIRSDFYPQV